MSVAGVLCEIEDDTLFSGRTGILHGDGEYIKRGASSAGYYLVGWNKESPRPRKTKRSSARNTIPRGLTA